MYYIQRLYTLITNALMDFPHFFCHHIKGHSREIWSSNKRITSKIQFDHHLTMQKLLDRMDVYDLFWINKNIVVVHACTHTHTYTFIILLYYTDINIQYILKMSFVVCKCNTFKDNIRSQNKFVQIDDSIEYAESCLYLHSVNSKHKIM